MVNLLIRAEKAGKSLEMKGPLPVHNSVGAEESALQLNRRSKRSQPNNVK
jgi:hypothetical protein